jgi:hypothetical protein
MHYTSLISLTVKKRRDKVNCVVLFEYGDERMDDTPIKRNHP